MTFTEWGEKVSALLPEFGEFAAQNSMQLNLEAAQRLLDEGEYLTVWTMLRAVCDGLPDDPSSYGGRYTDLCQICEDYPHEETH